MTPGALARFYDQLSRHDWTYMMSDDPAVYRRGSASASEIERLSKSTPAHKELYDAYHAHVWKKGPKPERPDADG